MTQGLHQESFSPVTLRRDLRQSPSILSKGEGKFETKEMRQNGLGNQLEETEMKTESCGCHPSENFKEEGT